MTEKQSFEISGPITQRLYNAYLRGKSKITKNDRMKELALTSALRMLRGAGLFPSTFNVSVTEDEARDALTIGIEVLRMVRDGDEEADNDDARRIYREYFM